MNNNDAPAELNMAKYRPTIVDILLIGEQLRIQMHTSKPQLLCERRYLLYKYRRCFIGKEAVDWLIDNGEVLNRQEAVYLMRLLQENHIIQSVLDSESFQDGSQFYRFKKDVGTFPWNDDVALFLKGQRLFNRLKHSRKSAMRNVLYENKTYANAFFGDEMVTWLVNNNEVNSREQGINTCKRMLENDVIKQVEDRHHFKDDLILYQFKVDFSRKKILRDLLGPTRVRAGRPNANESAIAFQETAYSFSENENHRSDNISIQNNNIYQSTVFRKTSSRGSSFTSTTSSFVSDEDMTSDPDFYYSSSPNSVPVRRATVEELEKTQGSYVKKHVRIMSDPVGYGFVIRGDAPVHVQTVDPSGPAAHAGLKVGQFIYSVNDKINVLRMSHKDLAKVILASDGYVDIVVMERQHNSPSDTDNSLH